MPDHQPVQTLSLGRDEASLDACAKGIAAATWSSQVGQPVYDARTLGELEEIFGRPRLLDLLGRLKIEIAHRLQASSDERDILSRDAHTLLSVSGSLGFVDLSQRCVEIEQACLRGADLAAPLEAARSAAEAAMAAIRALEKADPILG